MLTYIVTKEVVNMTKPKNFVERILGINKKQNQTLNTGTNVSTDAFNDPNKTGINSPKIDEKMRAAIKIQKYVKERKKIVNDKQSDAPQR